jgi:hypothetical protein
MSVALTARNLNGTKGLGLRGYSDALVIPIHPELHYAGPDAIDGHMGRSAWEAKYGTQESHLDAVGEQIGIDLWRLHAEFTGQLEKYRPKSGGAS